MSDNSYLVNQPFTTPDLDKIHGASMKILEQQGIVINSEKVLSIFKKHGFKIHGSNVFFTEQQVLSAVESAPEQFEIRARNS
ncbi:MAG: hypothetical protein GY860_06335, partial [Desulfobacteraceae bacterium]|nr:hypothetical protein [Desulfobacteraceae bacterium]